MSDTWWEDVIKPNIILKVCHYTATKNPKVYGGLVAADEGIAYGAYGKVELLVPWENIANFQLLETKTPQGRQRSAVGVGPLGLLAVGATMAHNKKASKLIVRRFVRLTNKQGQHGEFTVIGDTSIAVAQGIAAHFKSWRPSR